MGRLPLAFALGRGWGEGRMRRPGAKGEGGGGGGVGGGGGSERRREDTDGPQRIFLNGRRISSASLGSLDRVLGVRPQGAAEGRRARERDVAGSSFHLSLHFNGRETTVERREKGRDPDSRHSRRFMPIHSYVGGWRETATSSGRRGTSRTMDWRAKTRI
jgi:hypothetical protein